MPDPVVVLSGFPPDAKVQARASVEFPCDLRDSQDYFHQPNFYQRHPTAAVRLEQQVLASADAVVVNLDDHTVEAPCHMMFAAAMDRIVIAVTTTAAVGGWVTAVATAVLPSLPEALAYLGRLLQTHPEPQP